jgi:hypothetical protein
VSRVTVATKVISAVYPVLGGVGAALTTRGALLAARRFVVGNSRTPSGRGSGGTALVWTALSWAVPAGVGLYTGRMLIRPASVGTASVGTASVGTASVGTASVGTASVRTGVAPQPAQS